MRYKIKKKDTVIGNIKKLETFVAFQNFTWQILILLI